MKTSFSSLQLVLFALFSFILSSCVQTEEILKFKEDGKVEYEINVKVASFDEKKVQQESGPNVAEELKKNFNKMKEELNFGDEIKIIGTKEILEGGYQGAQVTLEIPDTKSLQKMAIDKPDVEMPDLDKAVKPNQENPEQQKKKVKRQLSGWKIEKLSNGNYLLSRKVEQEAKNSSEKIAKGKSKKSEDKNKATKLKDEQEQKALMGAMIGMRYEIISPFEIVSSNAQQHVGQSLRWQVNAGYLLEKAFEMRAEVKAHPLLEQFVVIK